MMVWVDIVAVFVACFLAVIAALILMMRPLTNIIAYKVHRKLMKQISAAEDKFASRGKI